MFISVYNSNIYFVNNLMIIFYCAHHIHLIYSSWQRQKEIVTIWQQLIEYGNTTYRPNLTNALLWDFVLLFSFLFCFHWYTILLDKFYTSLTRCTLFSFYALPVAKIQLILAIILKALLGEKIKNKTAEL